MIKLNHLKIAAIMIAVILAGVYLSKDVTSAYKEAQVVTGYRLTVDGVSWGVVEDSNALNTLLDEYKQSYMGSISESDDVKSVDFKQLVEIREVEVKNDAFTSIENIREKVYSIEMGEVYYTVKKGDSFWAIANSNKIPLARIIQLNPEFNPEKIWAGNKILFEPADPVLDVVVTMESTLVEPVEYTTEYIKDASILNGQRVVVKAGVEGSKQVTYDIVMTNGYETSTVITNETQISAPVGAVVKVGTKRTLVRTSSRNFGVATGRLSSNYGWRIDPISRRRAFHTGIDISAPAGSPVYAYANGTVTESGWNNTRGYYVTIDHGNGLKTVYLHLSARLVGVGAQVAVGQQIGKIGSTGYATGPHLHFGVFKNGVVVSPWEYL